MKMNLKILQKSKIGFTLNFLRKATSDESVKKSAKTLIKKWQGLEETKEKQQRVYDAGESEQKICIS